MRRHNHFQALSTLGLLSENTIFPAVIQCPFCEQNALYLFDDLQTENIWLSCQNCKRHGDIITFGSQLWNISVPNTLEKFSQADVISPGNLATIAEDYAKVAPRIRAAEEFFAEAQGRLWTHSDPVLTKKLLKLGVRNEIAGQIDFLGVSTYTKVAEIYRLFGRIPPTRARRNGEFIVFPFHTLPHKIAGFLLLQYTEDGASQYTFLSPENSRRKAEAGYFLLPQVVFSPAEAFKKTQIIAHDLLWALKVQCAQLFRGQRFLPIMVAYNSTDAESYGGTWRSFPQADRVFVGNALTPALISRAANAKGYVTVMRIGESPGGYDYTPPVINQIKAARKKAQTWQSALRVALSNIDDMTAQSFISNLTIPVEKLALFFKKNPHPFSPETVDRALLEVKLAPLVPTRITTTHRWAITERDQSWWAKGGAQVCNAQPIILKILQKENGERLYVGKVFFKGEEYDFTAPLRTIENIGLLTHIANELAKHGRLVIFNKAWNHRAHVIAQQLHAPEIVHVSTQRGWDTTANTFKFGEYELTANGVVQDSVFWPNHKIQNTLPPLAAIAPPAIYDLLTPSPDHAFVWATFAATAANLLAPIFNKEFKSVAVENNSFDAAMTVAETLACRVEQNTDVSRRYPANFIRKVTAEDTWPVGIFNVFNDDYFCSVAPKCHNLPIMVKMSPTGAASALSYGWTLLRGGQFKNNPHVLKYALPAYIQHVLAARHRAFVNKKDFVLAVLENIHEWAHNIYGKTFNLEYAKTKLVNADHAHDAIMRVIGAAVLNDEIPLLPQPRTRRQTQNYLLKQKTEYWISKKVVDQYFFNRCYLPPNWFSLLTLLQQNGSYLGEKIIHNSPGILLAAAWAEPFFTSEIDAVKEVG